MANEPRINDMGNEVVEGYACKPKNFDPNRPIMHFQAQIFICDDERCASAAKAHTAESLRALLKEMGLNKGQHRIKISRSRCFGACRFRQVAEIVAHTSRHANACNNVIFLRRVHRFDTAKWRTLFEALRDNTCVTDILDANDIVPMKVYE